MDEEQKDVCIDEVDQELIPFKDRAEEFFQGGETTVRMYLYRFLGDSKKQEFLDKYEGSSLDEFPDEKDIGIEFGGGRFRVHFVWPKSNNGSAALNKQWVVRISSHYTNLLKKENIVIPSPNNQVQYQPGYNYNPADTLKPIIDLLSTVIPVFLPLFKNRESNVADLQKVLSDMMVSNAKNMNELLTTTVREQQKMYNEIMQNNVSGNEVDDTGINNVIAEYLPVIQQFLPMLAGPAPVSTAVAKTANSLPIIQKLKQNTVLLKKLIAELQSDPACNKEMLTKVLGKLKIAVPK